MGGASVLVLAVFGTEVEISISASTPTTMPTHISFLPLGGSTSLSGDCSVSTGRLANVSTRRGKSPRQRLSEVSSA